MASRYEKGRCVKSLDALWKQKTVFWYSGKTGTWRVVDRGWFASWHLGYAAMEVRVGNIYEAKSARTVKEANK